MEKFFYYTGLVFWIAFALAATLAILLAVAAVIVRFWRKYRFRLWAYQVYEYLHFKKAFEADKRDGFINCDLEAVKFNRSKMFGLVKGMEYRKRNLFTKQIVTLFDEIIEFKSTKTLANVGQ